MSSVYILANGGLGNRFNSMLTGLYISFKLGRQPVIIWPKNNWCGAGFDDIFESRLDFVDDFDYAGLVNSGRTINILHNNFYKPDLTWIDINHTTLESILDHATDRTKNLFTGTDKLASFVEFDVIKHEILPMVEFKQVLTNNAKVLQHQLFNSYYYGLHLRHTDASEYVDKLEMERIVDNNSDKQFFICSDDYNTEIKFAQKPNVKCNLKKNYVTRLNNDLYSFRNNVDRSKQSVLEAVIDLLLLSYSDLSYNNSMSSFLSLARLIQKCNQ